MILDCDRVAGSCSGGKPRFAVEWYINHGTPAPGAYHGYVAKQETCGLTANTKMLGTKIFRKFYNFHIYTDQQLMWLTNRNTISACIYADFCVQHYSGGYFLGEAPECRCNKYYYANHAIALVGYGYMEPETKSKAFWILRNSWGTCWGMAGYMHLAAQQITDRKYGIANIRMDVTWLAPNKGVGGKNCQTCEMNN